MTYPWVRWLGLLLGVLMITVGVMGFATDDTRRGWIGVVFGLLAIGAFFVLGTRRARGLDN